LVVAVPLNALAAFFSLKRVTPFEMSSASNFSCMLVSW